MRTKGGAWLDIQPARSGALARATLAQLPSAFGPRATFMPGARIYAGSVFGADLFVGDGASISEGCRFGDRCVVGRNSTVGPGCRFGDGVRIMDLAHIVGGTVIGDDCFIAMGVMTCNDRRPLPYVYDETRNQPIRIGSRVMIGAGATLYPGVAIGDGAWISAGARVCCDVLPGERVRAEGDACMVDPLINVDTTIASSESLSDAVTLDGANVVGIMMPATWTAAGLSFQASADGVTYGDVYDVEGDEVTIDSAAADAGKFIVIPAGGLDGCRYLKVRSGTSGSPVAQSDDCVLTLVTRRYN